MGRKNRVHKVSNKETRAYSVSMRHEEQKSYLDWIIDGYDIEPLMRVARYLKGRGVGGQVIRPVSARYCRSVIVITRASPRVFDEAIRHVRARGCDAHRLQYGYRGGGGSQPVVRKWNWTTFHTFCDTCGVCTSASTHPPTRYDKRPKRCGQCRKLSDLELIARAMEE